MSAVVPRGLAALTPAPRSTAGGANRLFSQVKIGVASESFTSASFSREDPTMPDTAVVSVAVAAASCASAVLSSSGVAMLKNLFDENLSVQVLIAGLRVQ